MQMHLSQVESISSNQEAQGLMSDVMSCFSSLNTDCPIPSGVQEHGIFTFVS